MTTGRARDNDAAIQRIAASVERIATTLEGMLDIVLQMHEEEKSSAEERAERRKKAGLE